MTKPKRALIISYYWPPSGGAGVQRWLKFAKYLPGYNWTPVVYSPSNPHYPVIDETLAKDVPEQAEIVQYPIWEPYTFYKKLMGMKKEDRVQHGFITEKGQSVARQKIATWIRGNFFIPDARKFWIKPSIRFLVKYLRKHPVDVIVSTGPPHSMHLIALGVKKATGLPWLADFRDPWTEIDFYDQLYLTGWADTKHRRQEAQVLQYADRVTTVSWDWAKGLEKLGGEKVDIITNGFDEADVVASRSAEENPFFEILHVGSMNKDRNSIDLWAALNELLKEQEGLSDKLRITLIGKNDHQVVADIEKHGLTPYLELPSYLPHNQVFEKLKFASVLLLPLNNTPNVEGIIPGKLFEYLSAERPILCIGSVTGDSARIIDGAKAGKTVNFGDKDQLKEILTGYFHAYQANGLSFASDDVGQYSRKSLTGQLVRLLNELVG